MRKLVKKITCALPLMALFALGCAQGGEVASGEVALSTTCESTPTDGFSQVCKPSAGVAKHYRIDGVQTSTAHSSVSLFIGFASQPASGNTNPAAGVGEAKV